MKQDDLYPPFVKLTAPRIVWKKCCVATSKGERIGKFCLVKLEIPKGAIVADITYRVYGCAKKRASSARVLGAYDMAGKPLRKGLKATSWRRDHRLTYKKGKKLRPRHRFSLSHKVCASGIHFFDTREEAIKYDFW